MVLYIKGSWKISKGSACRNTKRSVRARKSHRTPDVIIGIEMAAALVVMATLLAHLKENKLGRDLGGVKKDGVALVGYL